MFLKQRRRTPWDAERLDPLALGLSAQLERGVQPESVKLRSGRKEVFCLHGLYVFDPAQATSDDFRQFMWAGLRVLRAEAKVRGLSEDQIRQLLVSAFDAFHDSAEGMWTALKTVVSKEEPQGAAYGKVSALVEPFVACEEDRPVPVNMHFTKPLTLLDPDADLLSSFEP
jgi:hypothetical protein